VCRPARGAGPGAPLVHESSGGTRTHCAISQPRDVDRALAEAAGGRRNTYRLPFVTQACLGTMVAARRLGPRREPDDVDDDPGCRSSTGAIFGEALGSAVTACGCCSPPWAATSAAASTCLPRSTSIAALLALRCRRPVKTRVRPRGGVIIACPGREPCTIRLRTAADRDGRLLARDAHVTIDNGAYTSWGSTTPYVDARDRRRALPPSRGVRFDTTICTRTTRTPARCAVRQPESTFAVESQMDDLAERLRAGPARRAPPERVEAGRREPAGVRAHVVRDDRVYRSPRPRRCGEDPPPLRPGLEARVGYAGMFHVRWWRADLPLRRLRRDRQARRLRKVSLLTGASEIARGGDRPRDDRGRDARRPAPSAWTVVNSDTSVRPWDVGAHASRTTFLAGNAARLAARR